MAQYLPIGDPANEAEREGFRLLRDRLPDHFVVLGNFDLRLPNRHTSLEYDAVIIGEYGFYAVEIKGWTGVIKGGDRHWVLPWERRPNPLIHLDRKTKTLGQFVRQRVDGLTEDCFFASAMLFPCEDVRFELPQQQLDCIVKPGGVYDFFVDLDLVRQHGPGPFREQEKTDEVVEAIVSVAEPAEDWVHLSYYDVEGERELDDVNRPYREFVGYHQYLRNRGKVRIKAYTMDRLVTGGKRREEQNRILRDLDALEVLHDNPYVARSYEMQPDYDDPRIFYLISEWVSSTTLNDEISRLGDSGEDRRRRRQLMAHLVEAIASIHDAGIVHRNFSPYVVYLTEDDEAVPLKIADFDFARVAKLETIADALSHVGTDGYKAPELWLEDDYDHRVDIFSLGATLFELATSETLFLGPGALLRPEQAWQKRRRLVDDADLREVIGEMICTDLDRRSEGMQQARQLFSGCL